MLICDNCQTEFKLATEISCGHTLCTKCLEIVNEHSAICPVHHSLVTIVKHDIQQEREIDVKKELNEFFHEQETEEEKPYNSRSMTSQLHTHISRERHFDALIKCSFWSVGCPFQGLPFDVEHHEANTRYHLDILLKSHIEQKRQVQELKEKASVMRSALQFCEKFVSGMESTIKSVEKETQHVVPQLKNIEKELKSMKDVIANVEKDYNFDSKEETSSNNNPFTSGIFNQKFEEMKSKIENLSLRIAPLEESKKHGCDLSLKHEIEFNKLKVSKGQGSETIDVGATSAEFFIYKNKLELLEGIVEGRSFSHVWKIDSVKHILRQTRQGIYEGTFSKPFFSSRAGYKMQMSISSNADYYVRATHLSCFLHICKGLYDDILKWPITYEGHFILLDQSNSDNHIAGPIALTDCEETVYATMKPSDDDDDNGGWGMTFVPLARLKSPYVVNDTMFIKLELKLTN